jgi:oligoendopeptidase F
MPTLARLASLATLALAAAPAAPGSRAADPARWDLTDLYPGDADWEASLKELAAKTHALEPFQGRLASDAATLREALEALFDLRLQTGRLGSYAQMRGDEDTREAGPQGMQQSLQTTSAELQAAVAWVEPEILAIPPDKLRAFVEKDSGLGPYRRYLERLEKRRPHVLDAAGERLLGLSERVRGTGATVGTLLRNAEIPWPTIRIKSGDELRVDAIGYTKGRALPERSDRIAVYEAFYGELQRFKGSLAATLSATVQEHVFETRSRGYASSLEASLAGNEVDPAVYHMLVREVNASLPSLHRYLRLRARMLGLSDLRYHDLYPPLVPAVKADYGWENARRLVGEALRPLGEDYASRLRRALEGRWVDVYPRIGKRSGAYVEDGGYGVHPYMLLNHQDDYPSATTLAHEGGHLMHSWYSQEAQPFPTARYEIFVAEVASTVNEVLFFRHLLGRAEDDDARLALLGSFLEGLRTTVFRQTMFAEFELAIHEMAERGEPLTGESLNALYLGLLRRYHGEAEGVAAIDERYAAEWAWVPHFHYDFYVYQYATSYVAAIALSEGILADRPGARERYLAFLRSGSTKPPAELLRDAGVDVASPEPLRAAMRLMNEIIGEMEAILARRKPAS